MGARKTSVCALQGALAAWTIRADILFQGIEFLREVVNPRLEDVAYRDNTQ